MKKLIVKYYESQFDFILTDESETYLKGFLGLNEEDKTRYYETVNRHEEDIDDWYLDKNGDRLCGNELFAKSPWSLIENGKMTQIVQRFFNIDDGETIFAKQAWFRIGDFI